MVHLGVSPVAGRLELTIETPMTWLLSPDAHAPTPLRLFAFAFAGGGATFYRRWQPHLPAGVTIVPVQLPGRETRIRERPLTSMASVVSGALAAARPLMTTPWAVLGHSMGGAIALEFTLAAEAEGLRSPELLIVSARRAPRLPNPHPPLFALPERELLAAMTSIYGPLPLTLLKHPALMASFLPAIRADFQVLDTWAPDLSRQVACDLLALIGADDRSVAVEQLEGWDEATTGSITTDVLPGGHMNVRDGTDVRDRVARALAERLR